MRIIVTGAGGRLGPVVSRELAAAGHEVTPLPRTDLDICDWRQLAIIGRLRPHVIVNCASYNAVDAAEANPADAFALNARGPALLAEAAGTHDALFVHYSTDFVFDGESDVPYSEDAQPNPLSVYGRSKLEGEDVARRTPRHYVLRLASLFGGLGVRAHQATIDRIADNLLAGVPVRAFVDRTVSPSYAVDVARATRALIEKNAPYATYHCVSSGFATWYDLATEVAKRLGASVDIVPSLSADSGPGARRPQFCALSNQRLLALGIDMPTWQSAVERHLAARWRDIPATPALS